MVTAGLAITIAALAVACGNSDPKDAENGGADDPREVEISVSLKDRRLVPDTIRVSRDAAVTLKIESDAPGSLHLHGYDLEQEVAPGTVSDFVFVAHATGRYRIAFHPAASGGRDVMESEVPVSVSVTAEQDDTGGVGVHIVTEGWRWAPEEVNMADSPGAGHAHVYVDGVKINRVYGPYYHLTGLEPGTREIRVTLNANSHSDLTYAGLPLEAATTVSVSGDRGAAGRDRAALDAADAMSVEVMAHPDPLGGYNLQVIPTGFEFTPGNVGGGHVAGEGFAYVLIDGELHARLYTPWLKLPALEPGMREITVSLAGNQGRPYHWRGRAVVGSTTVHAPAEQRQDDSNHHSSSGSGERMDHDAAEQGGVATASPDAEYNVGYLEVHPG